MALAKRISVYVEYALKSHSVTRVFRLFRFLRVLRVFRGLGGF